MKRISHYINRNRVVTYLLLKAQRMVLRPINNLKTDPSDVIFKKADSVLLNLFMRTIFQAARHIVSLFTFLIQPIMNDQKFAY